MQFYRISGLLVQSAIVLPVALPVAADVPDVVIRYGPVPETLPDATASGRTWAMAGDRFLLHIADVGRFLLIEGREIVIEPVSEASKADVPIFALGTVFGLLQHQRARIVLHASAVAVNGRAVLFCGRSGAGKSTLAAALAQRGYPLVSDDVCAIAISADKRPVVHPDGRKLKLWAEPIDGFGLTARRGERVRRNTDKYYVDLGVSTGHPLTIAAIYNLKDVVPPAEASIAPLNAVDTALVFKRHAYRPQMVRRFAQAPIYLSAAAAIAETADVFTLNRVRDLARMPALVDSLETHWRDLSLAPARG